MSNLTFWLIAGGGLALVIIVVGLSAGAALTAMNDVARDD